MSFRGTGLKPTPLSRNKGSRREVEYLKELPEKWQSGLRYIRKFKKKEDNAIFFLGNPIRMATPVYKKGLMVPLGFSMSLESLMSLEKAIFSV